MVEMAASSTKQKKDLLTEEDISKVLDKEGEINVFCVESDDFCFDTSEEDSDSESDTSSVLHEIELYEGVLDFSRRFVRHCVSHPRLAFLHVSGVNVDFDDGNSVLECFHKFISEDM
jgi:hypothetical protein